MLKTLTAPAAALGALVAAAACSAQKPDPTPHPAPAHIEDVRITLPDSRPRPPFTFSDEDAALLDEVQRGAFNFLWTHVSPTTGMVFDRTNSPAISIGGVGFQISAIPVAIERGWITREQGEARTLQILKAIDANPRNRVRGMFFHFLDQHDAGPTHEGYEHIVSTVDSALFFAGALTAAAYFDGEIADIAERLVAGAEWTFFLAPDSAPAHERGFISLGWRATGETEDGYTGELLPFYWLDAGDEQLLTTFLAVAAPNEAHRVEPTLYYTLRRRLGAHGDIGPFSWFPWSGALFTNIFAHCWIDYAHMGLDNPKAQGVDRRPRVDWWANSAMAVAMHRAKAIENPKNLPTLGPDAWGLTACDFAGGYLVPSLFPRDVPMPGAIPEMDYSPYVPEENWGDGTVATYGAAMAVLFDPEHALRALRHYKALAQTEALRALWSDPATGGLGLADSFNEGTGWVSPIHFPIDAGPIVLAIENARTGQVTRLFHAHPIVRAGADRLGWPAPR